MIETESLSMRFGNVDALVDLTLSVAPGEVFGFLGPNGAGKTTTLRLLLGLLKPTGGTCRVLGYDLARDADRVRQRCGAMLESSGLYENLSVAENLRFYARVQGVAKSRLPRVVDQALERFGLGPKRNQPAGALSCGMKQKLGIARAMLHGPDLLFLDEPTRGLDPAARVELRRLLLDLSRDEGVALFLTSHDLAEIERCCQRVGLLLNGRLKTVATVEAFCRAEEGEVIVLRAPAIAPALVKTLSQGGNLRVVERGEDQLTVAVPLGHDATPLIRRALDCGIALQEVRRERLSLEDAYLNQLGTA